ASQNGAAFASLAAASGAMHVTGNGHLELADWILKRTSQIRLNAHFEGVDLAQLTSRLPVGDPPSITGIASGSVDLSGPLFNPVGNAQVRIDSFDSSGLRLNQIKMQAILGPNQARLEQGRMQSGSAVVSFSGTYSHAAGRWRDGRLSVKIDTNGFPLASIPEWRQREPDLGANAEIHAQGTVRILSGHVEPATADGLLNLRDIAFNGSPLGALRINAITTGNTLKANVAGELGGHPIAGAASVQLAPGSPMSSKLHFDHLDLALLQPIFSHTQVQAWPF